ncbi:MAG: hypothetical protein HLUCCA12_02415 [Rhodobacteraceae bacterium HLUCCA12]|nr:MAG: hypothetical protein HLUCCA12_02415 [Rhodobacteraceae bacterium HLUCCA12]
MTKHRENRISRRGLFGAALGAGAASALSVGGARPVMARETGDERTRARYRETEHVETFYRTNRYYRPEE